MITKKIRFTSLVLALLMIVAMIPISTVTANAAEALQTTPGTSTYSLFNSGRGNSSPMSYSSASGRDANYNSKSYSNNGYDLYGSMSGKTHLTIGMGLSFTVNSAVTEKATLTVKAYDVDEGSGEYDVVHLVDVTAGTKKAVGNLKGMDEQWNVTTLEIDPASFTAGHTYRFELEISDVRDRYGWIVYVRTVSIELTSAGQAVPEEKPAITSYSFSASINNTGRVTADLSLATSEAVTYKLEFAASINNDQRGSLLNQSISASPAGVSGSYSFQLESGAPKGTYRIDVILKDANDNTVTTFTTTAGYSYSSVSYDPNGGSKNLPLDSASYSSGNTVTVLFDYIPSKEGYEFLGWARTSDAAAPEFTKDGNKTFVISSSDVTLYAVWKEIKAPVTPPPTDTVDTWDGTYAAGFGGGQGTAADPYLIYTAEELAYLAQSTNNGNNYAGKYIKLMSDIDLADIEWIAIGYGTYSSYGFSPEIERLNNTFCGSFDGQGHKIKNLKDVTANSSFCGLFGALKYATIENLGVETAKVGSDMPLGYRANNGALAGLIYKTEIKNCYTYECEVTALSSSSASSSGGLIGIVSDSTVTNCFSTANCTSNGHSGVLIGGDYSEYGTTIQYCYAIGTATYLNKYVTNAAKTAGGIIGFCSSITKVNFSFFMGSVSAESSGPICGLSASRSKCYYYVIREDQASNYGNATPEDFKSASWINVNMYWDFTNVWTFDTNGAYEYPTLKGFGSVGGNNGGNGGGNVCTHQNTETVNTPNSCGASGSIVTTCNDCGTVISNVYLPALVHKYQSKLTKEVTCTTPGIITYTCEECEDSYVTYIYSEHNMQKTHVAPTCTVDGKDVYSCTKCSYSYEEKIPAGHSYSSEVIKAASQTEEGLVRYTCAKCGDFYDKVLPTRPEASVLLVEDRLPWSEKSNSVILERLLKEGFITGYDVTTTSALTSLTLSDYTVIFIANDQTTATYNKLAEFNEAIENFAKSGGVVIYGACDSGWAGGSLSYPLPGGVTKGNYYSYRNYIANNSHPIITGIFTDGKAITNDIFYCNYTSHTYFNKNTLPMGANVILNDANGNATLVEYPLGNGLIIASGLTWEYAFVRNLVSGTSYAKCIYDDLIVYAAGLGEKCEHEFDGGKIVEPTCESEGYTLYACTKCKAQIRTDVKEKTAHIKGAPTEEVPPTFTTEGMIVVRCTECEELLDYETIPRTGDSISTFIESDKTNLTVGETVTLRYGFTNGTPLNAIKIIPEFDASVFELVEIKWLAEGFEEQTIDMETLECYAKWSEEVYLEAVIEVTLKAKADCEIARFDADLSIYDANMNEKPVTMQASKAEIAPCTHITLGYESISGDVHTVTCLGCGYIEVKAHAFDSCCDEYCNDCNYRIFPDHAYDDDKDAICNECGAERLVRGDLDGDEVVTKDDAIYLMMNVFFPDDYPLDQAADLDDSGKADKDDAIYLMMSIFFPNDYPLG